MSRGDVKTAETLLNVSRSNLQGWLEGGRRWLYPYRPRFEDWRFWAIQGLVLFVAGIHATAEILKILGHPVFLGSEPSVALASFVTVSLFFVPVVYAALNFGLAGSIATALWCTLLTIPNILVLHEGMERVREVFQIGIVDAIAVFVGQRVEHEMAARQRAEAAGAALMASEVKYRGLFESSPTAILVLDPSGAVLEANPAASLLFGKPPDSLRSTAVADLVGRADAARLLDASQDSRGQAGYLVLKQREGSEIYVEPALTWITNTEGKPTIQVLLRDVTEEHHRQAGLRAYAAHMLRAQEEERKRMAQELHDETVQALVLLCRRLDALEGTSGPLPSSAMTGLQEARRSAEAIVEELRDFARALRPPALDDLGLVTCIRTLLVDLTERAHLKGRLKVLGEERRLPPDTELGLFRIAQEALRNVERHAQATHVAVAIAFTENKTRLDVHDDGVGFILQCRPNDFATSGHLGLLGIQERAELLGGRLEIQSSPQNGTRVIVSIPRDGEERRTGAA